ncbi:radical SAM protein [Paenibacillus zanthoxyli]|uniref:radical SAM protein n=1 Tax=Paenibacillus zanthoxyli TaxID=369399 RepID=UPI000A05369F|nr:radical SAM protein [Paenibacillus zanthoxyli]
MANESRHPCYDEMAHHYFARMHVAVAPKCNINCNYCNIKYDCVSESRPGVVSKVLTPQEAYAKVRNTLASLPQLTVVGIAGPGDPLANPQETFETFGLLSEGLPELQLCLSTNGLKLPDYSEDIVTHRPCDRHGQCHRSADRGGGIPLRVLPRQGLQGQGRCGTVTAQPAGGYLADRRTRRKGQSQFRADSRR